MQRERSVGAHDFEREKRAGHHVVIPISFFSFSFFFRRLICITIEPSRMVLLFRAMKERGIYIQHVTVVRELASISLSTSFRKHVDVYIPESCVPVVDSTPP